MARDGIHIPAKLLNEKDRVMRLIKSFFAAFAVILAFAFAAPASAQLR